MFDITTQAVADTAPIHIKGADGSHLYLDGKPVRIILYSPGSSTFAEVEDRQTARAVKRMQDNDGKVSVPPLEVRDAEQAEDLATLTAGFENLGYPPAGEKQGKELYRALYADKKLGFIVTQVQKALRDWGNFKAASTGA
jgi:hypothetical protein